MIHCRGEGTKRIKKENENLKDASNRNICLDMKLLNYYW